jgi:hypothetical protein
MLLKNEKNMILKDSLLSFSGLLIDDIYLVFSLEIQMRMLNSMKEMEAMVPSHFYEYSENMMKRIK